MRLFYLLFFITLFSYSQEHDYIMKCDDVTATLLKHKNIIIKSDNSNFERRILLISNESDTIFDIKKKANIYKEIKDFKPSKGQLLELKVITYKENGWISKSNLYWFYTIFFD
jgi:hypothetical protein